MANLKEIRSRITTVKNTRKITSAMSRIAAARLVKAQQAAMGARPYGERLDQVVGSLVASLGGESEGEEGAAHPLLLKRSGNGRVVIVHITADRGLAGGFNANINRAVVNFIRKEREAGNDVVLLTVGKKGRSFFQHSNQRIVRHHDAPTLADLVVKAKAIASEVMAMFTGGKEGGDTDLPQVDRVYFAYNYFKNVLTQQPRIEQLLPFESREIVNDERVLPVLEPGRDALLGHLLPIAVESRLQQAFFNSIAGEIAARRTAMDSASDNATQLIRELTLFYNRERQAAITKELMEIIGGAEALKG
ncbi:ATP synthase F1 subunit gamma [Nannocystis pusilla]|uniref:ATP synthase gamma chain n=1 Tax=Nannocystis pusilla TaxID=889268 RepID=A0ABS7TRS4_9BACT|nr:ATP synthase F1 subunit gamma [Nannocystis pusilla]MBZ5710932.1 ATP synthase F1 subunit gamma [Nannocystis pusilla]